MSLRIIGLDLSLTATGICHSDGSTGTVMTKTTDGDRRLLAIDQRVRLSVGGPAAGFRSRPADLVVIEFLPAHIKSAGITGMVHGVVRAALLNLGVPYVYVTPATLKKYATGSGNADKTAMAVSAMKRAELEFADDNQCDAWWLRAAALDHYGAPVVPVPAAQRAALAKVAWPELTP